MNLKDIRTLWRDMVFLSSSLILTVLVTYLNILKGWGGSVDSFTFALNLYEYVSPSYYAGGCLCYNVCTATS